MPHAAEDAAEVAPVHKREVARLPLGRLPGKVGLGPEQLGQYMDYFNPDFTALTGNPDNMKKLAAQLNAFYARVDREDGGYLMDHSANIVLLDSGLNYRGYIEPPHDPKRMLPVIRSLLALP